MGDVILTMKDIDKSFPGVHALDHVNFEVKRGEVHALMGENGAGKSTLMKVLTGIYQKDSGTITYKGKETEFHNTREAQDAGVVIVHQELNMIGDLTVAQNIFIGREPKKGIRVDDKKMIEDSKKLFQDLNIEIDPREKMSNLTVGKQQMCEIAKAISHKAEVIIFDEPSAALTEKEIADLFVIIRDLREKNLGIVYISHRMDEIKVITDRVTVMRDGGYVGTLITAESSKEDIINMMVGRVIYEDPKEHSMVAPDAPVVLKVEHLNAGKMVQDVSFELHKGEILGFSGLMGAGRAHRPLRRPAALGQRPGQRLAGPGAGHRRGRVRSHPEKGHPRPAGRDAGCPDDPRPARGLQRPRHRRCRQQTLSFRHPAARRKAAGPAAKHPQGDGRDLRNKIDPSAMPERS